MLSVFCMNKSTALWRVIVSVLHTRVYANSINHNNTASSEQFQNGVHCVQVSQRVSDKSRHVVYVVIS